MTTPAPSFADLVRDVERDLPLDVATATLAAEERGGDVHAMLAGLDALARRVGDQRGRTWADAVAALHHTLFEVEGFEGDSEDYDDPRNSLLDDVLARRRGLPILLSVVYLEVARRVGIEAHGIGFPGHFLVGLADTDPPLFVDPFHKGALVPAKALRQRTAQLVPAAEVEEALAGWTAPASHRSILVRMANNLRLAYARRGDLAGSVRNLDRLVLLAPGEPLFRRDRGLLRAQLGLAAAAVDDLEDYLARRPDADDAPRVSLQLTMLLRKLR